MQASNIRLSAGVALIALLSITSAPAAAQGSATSQQRLPSEETDDSEIIVTAQSRKQNLQEVPISVGVLSGNILERTGTRSVSDALNQVAGVSLTEAQPGDLSIAIRGVSSGAGTSPTAYYQDEVPFSFVTLSQVPDTNAYDLARVEVLRGAQGTLYGASALGGVVRVITNDADLNDFGVKARVRASSTKRGGDNFAGDTAVNAVLIPGKLAIRGVASYSDLSGFIRSTFDGGKRINGTEAQAYRLKINAQPNEDLSIRFGFSRSDIRNDAPSYALDNYTTPFSSDQANRRELNTYNLVTTYDLPSVSILSSTAYLNYKTRSKAEILLSAVSKINVLAGDDLRSISQEVRLQSRHDGPWQWSSGAIYKDIKQKLYQEAKPFFPGINRWVQTSKSYAIFADSTLAIADDKVEITAGLRYFHDRIGRMDVSYLSNSPNIAAPIHLNFKKLTGRFVVTFKPQDNRIFYASVANGFRSGIARDTGLAQAGSDFPALRPDTLITYEAGAKGDFAGGVLTYNSSFYYMNWKDIQQTLIVPAGFNARVNAGRADGFGGDLGLAIHPSRTFTLTTNIGWNGLKTAQNVISRGVVLFQKGARITNSPEWTASIGVDYRTPSPMRDADFVLNGTFAYGSTRLQRFLTGVMVTQNLSDPLYDLRSSVGLETKNWALSIFAENLLNYNNAVNPPQPGLSLTSNRMRPRTIGIQLSVNF